METTASPAEVNKEDNPIVTELAQLDATGDDKEILAEIANLNAQEDGTPEPVPAASVEVPVAEAPVVEPVVTKPPETPAPSAVSTETQQYIARLEEQNRIAQQQNETRILADVVAAHAQQLEARYGLAPEHAFEIAKQQGDIVYRQYDQERLRQGQINAAFEIAKQHGVDARSIMNLPTPAAMTEAAKQATTQGKTEQRLAALEAENAALKKRLVPAQTFANNTVMPIAANNDNALLDQYNKGVRTEQTIAAARKYAGG